MSIKIVIEHSVEEVELILKSLAKHPYEEVAALIAKIHNTSIPQVIAQQSAAQAAAAPAPVAPPTPQAEPPANDLAAPEAPAPEPAKPQDTTAPTDLGQSQ